MSKTVLVTGGAGFIAHHVIENILRNTDWNVVSLDRLDFSGNLNRLHDMMDEFDAETRKRVRVVFHDLRAEINPMVARDIGDVEFVLHLAAGSHVDRSIEYPMEFVMDNVVGTANILDYARFLNDKKGLEGLIYFITDEVFGPALGDTLFKEWDRHKPTNPYSASKSAAEQICIAYVY